MRSFSAFVLALIPVAALAEEPPDRPDPTPAIDRGLAFLAEDAMAWKAGHNCVSCHHAGLVVWAFREAKGRGHAVDEAVLADMTSWIAESGDGTMAAPRPESRPRALSVKAMNFALALESDPEPDAASKEALGRFLKTIRADQTDDGSWQGWPGTRPPLFGDSDESMSALAALALLPAAEAGDEVAKAALDRGVGRLAEAKSDEDPQSVAMRLVLWHRLDRPVEEWRPLIQLIEKRQNADGGWSQAEGMPSDAWATGQALYALAHAEDVRESAVVAKAHAFLIATQRDDGSWPMTSRPMAPGGEGAKDLVPITAAGTAWAVLGLVRSH